MNDIENPNDERRDDSVKGDFASKDAFAPNPIAGETDRGGLELVETYAGAVDWRTYFTEIRGLCDVKAEEFRILGYKDVTGDEIWECVRQTNKKPMSIHELVGAVLGLQTSKFMNFTTVNAYKGVFSSSKFPSG